MAHGERWDPRHVGTTGPREGCCGWESSAVRSSEQGREPQLRAGPGTNTKANIWKGSYCPKITASVFSSKARTLSVGSRQSPWSPGQLPAWGTEVGQGHGQPLAISYPSCATAWGLWRFF